MTSKYLQNKHKLLASLHKFKYFRNQNYQLTYLQSTL